MSQWSEELTLLSRVHDFDQLTFIEGKLLVPLLHYLLDFIQ